MKRLELTLTKGFLMSLMMVLMLGFVTSCNDDDEELTGICTVSGRVVDLTGAPIEGANIEIAAEGANLLPAHATTDAEGKYKAILKEATTTLVISVECDGYTTDGVVISDIPYSGSTPDSLGEANITIADIVLYPKPQPK